MIVVPTCISFTLLLLEFLQEVGFSKIVRPIVIAQNTHTSLLESRKRKRCFMSLIVLKKRRWILPFTPSKDRTRRLQQMGSLASVYYIGSNISLVAWNEQRKGPKVCIVRPGDLAMKPA